MKRKVLTIFALLSVLWLMPWPVFAADILFNPTALALPVAEPTTVTVLVDTEQVSLNAVDGVVLVAKELGDAIQISDSGSMVTYWIKQPVWNAADHSISFSGAIPGGYTGSNGILFSIIVPPYKGIVLNNAFTVTDLHSYANDGLGTPVKISSKQFSIAQSGGAVDSSISDQLYVGDKKQDSIPPEMFSPQVSQDSRVFGNKWFVSFSTQDKQSGIDHYEIQESRSGAIDSKKWKQATSPYVLEDQELHSYIYITAIDRQGNERVIKVFPKHDSTWLYRYGWGIAGLLVVLALIVIGYWYHTLKDKKDSSVLKQNL